MANLVKNFLGYLRLNEDEDDYEDYVEDFEDIPEIPKRMTRSQPRAIDSGYSTQKNTIKQDKVTNLKREDDSLKDRAQRMERTTNSNIVPIRTTPRGLEVCIMKPASFEDTQDICDTLLGGRAVVVNLEGFDAEEAQRVMDFISGSVYAISGKLHQISRYIFIFSPDSIDISGDYLELLPAMGFDVPTLNKEF